MPLRLSPIDEKESEARSSQVPTSHSSQKKKATSFSLVCVCVLCCYYCYSLNAPGAFHSKRFNLEMNAGGVLYYLTPGAAYRENLGPLRSLILRLSVTVFL
jgi:hypothetical protein